jgi:hypothetical protein
LTLHAVSANHDARSKRSLRAKSLEGKDMFGKCSMGTLTLAVTFSAVTLAQGSGGTAAEAKAMLEKAVAAMKANETAALQSFNKGESGFKDRDLYVFCWDVKTGKFTAAVPGLVGTDVKALKERDGSPLGEKLINSAKEGAITSVTYNFPRPGTNDPVPKETYLARVGSQACGVGYYK